MAFFLALLAEGLLILLVLTLGSSIAHKGSKNDAIHMVSFKAAPEQPQPKPASKDKARIVTPAKQSPRQMQSAKVPLPPGERPKEQPLPQLIVLSRKELARADIGSLVHPPAPPRALGPQMGPVDMSPPPADTPRASGSGPHGEPLYAAAWYRKPYDDELSGYLSTATGPGWGLIACRTAPDYRVEDCVKLDEYPSGSNIARSVLAAAWQFRVRPPRIGGQPRIGEWVRIRIDYDLKQR